MLKRVHTRRERVTRHSSLLRTVTGELILVIGLFLVYRYARVLIGPTMDTAMRHAEDVIGVQHLLRLPSELAVQDMLLHSELLVRTANVFYATVHFPLTAMLLIWLFVRSRRHYFEIRTTLVGMTAIALVLHAAYPLAPPRMLSDVGFVDTAAVYGPSVYHAAPQTDSVANQFAAMPSLHFGWAVVVALAIIRVSRSRWRWLWIAHPVVTLVVIVGTGNHYWLDAAVAVALLVIADFAVRQLPLGRRLARPLPCGAGGAAAAEPTVYPSAHSPVGSESRTRDPVG